MRQRMLRNLGLFLLVGGFVLFSGCGHDQLLSKITVSPDTFSFSNVIGGETVQFSALGIFDHPPGQRDITHQVTWSTPATDVITIDQNGLATVTGLACGTNIPITATGSQDLHNPPTGNIITGTATVSVKLVGCQ